MPLMHSYSSDIAGVVLMISVSGGRSLRTSRGSKGVKVANLGMVNGCLRLPQSNTHTSLINFIAIQLFPPSTRSSNNRGASGRKSLGLLQPSSQTTLMMAAVTLGSSSRSMRRSLIFGHAARSVSGYTSARRYSVTIVFFRIAGFECVSRGNKSVKVDRARDGVMM